MCFNNDLIVLLSLLPPSAVDQAPPVGYAANPLYPPWTDHPCLPRYVVTYNTTLYQYPSLLYLQRHTLPFLFSHCLSLGLSLLFSYSSPASPPPSPPPPPPPPPSLPVGLCAASVIAPWWLLLLTLTGRSFFVFVLSLVLSEVVLGTY